MTTPLKNLGRYQTFKEIDVALGQPKGTAFKAFKAINPMHENEDFIYLSATENIDTIDQLKSENRIYATTINAVLLSQSGYDKIRNYLTSS